MGIMDVEKEYRRLQEGMKTVKGYCVRTACASDDLTLLWPAMAADGLNREQVLVAVDNDEHILGGVLMFHAEHSVAYVGEFTLAAGYERRRGIGRKLIDDMLLWCQRRGVKTVVFNVQDPAFAAMAQKLGATLVGHSMLLTMRVTPYETQHYGGHP